MADFTKIRLQMDELRRLNSILNATVERRIYDTAITQALDNLTFQLRVVDGAIRKEETR